MSSYYVRLKKALKGRNKIALGNAQGNRPPNDMSPEGAG
jgi:hypothetical protein